MQCEEARQIIVLDPDGVGPSNLSARAHVERCPACRAYEIRQARLAERVRRAASQAVVPAQLAAEVRRALEVAARPNRARKRWQWAAGGALAAAAGLTLLVLARTDSNDAVLPLATAARASLERSAEHGGDTLTIPGAESWVAARVGYRVTIPEIYGARLVNARIDSIAGERAVVVLYRKNGTPITYFALPTNRVSGVAIGGSGVSVRSAQGYQVALWNERGQARAIASPMSRDEVLAVARECLRKAAL
jgi:anti-sigma factor RsiW